MTVRDGIGRARFDAITAENTTRIIDVVHAGVALARGNPVRIHILGSFDINAIRWAGRRAEETAHTLLQAIFVAVEDVDPSITRLKMHRLVWIVFSNSLTKHISEGYAEALHERAKRPAHFPDDRWHGFSLAKGFGPGKSGPPNYVSIRVTPSALE